MGRAPAALALVLLGAVLLAGLATLWWTRGPDAPSASTPSHDSDRTEHVHDPRVVDPGPAPPRLDIVDPTRRAQPGTRPPLVLPTPEETAARFAGTGRVEGFLDVPDGVAVPRSWTLVLEPSKVLIGGENAEGRRVEFEAGEETFSLEDVPLGGYELRAEAPGMSGATDYLLLARPEAQIAIVRLSLSPAAYVEGLVVDEAGASVEGLEVLLVPREGGAARSATTGPTGAYLFELVPDGEYRLFLRDVNAPLLPPRELVVAPPSLHMPELTVPRLGQIQVRVFDSSGLLVAGARVEGWGSEGGRVNGVTDLRGELLARFLPAGRFTIGANAPPDAPAAKARRWVDLAPGARETLELRLEP